MQVQPLHIRNVCLIKCNDMQAKDITKLNKKQQL